MKSAEVQSTNHNRLRSCDSPLISHNNYNFTLWLAVKINFLQVYYYNIRGASSVKYKYSNLR